MDHQLQTEAIETIYDEQCYLETPYMVLQGRNEIIKSYHSLATNNLELILDIQSITFDPVKQTCMVDIQQTIRPKALGGMISIQMHFIAKYQLELVGEKYTIVEHTEIHVTQDLISQMPLIGSLYDSTIRNTIGQLSIQGTSLLSTIGFLDFAPRVVEKTSMGVNTIRRTIHDVANKSISIGSSALSKTGVPTLVNSVKNYIHWGAATLAEHGSDQPIICYSPTCEPGQLCYSPTCQRNQRLELSKQAVHDIIKGAYSDASSLFK